MTSVRFGRVKLFVRFEKHPSEQNASGTSKRKNQTEGEKRRRKKGPVTWGKLSTGTRKDKSQESCLEEPLGGFLSARAIRINKTEK